MYFSSSYISQNQEYFALSANINKDAELNEKIHEKNFIYSDTAISQHLEYYVDYNEYEIINNFL